jgi:dihydroneopterin aldolase
MPRPLPPRGKARGRAFARVSAATPRAAAPSATAPSAAAPTTEDWLRLAGIQAYGHLGVTLKERQLGQRVEADVELAYEPTSRRRPDSLAAFFDYEEVHRLVRSLIETSRCKLLETLADELALALIAKFDTPRVRVRLRKLHLPVPDFTSIPEVFVERART